MESFPWVERVAAIMEGITEREGHVVESRSGRVVQVIGRGGA